MGSEIKRKLAEIARIDDIQPIEGADRIVKVTIRGWNIVTQKSNNFEVGDLVLFFSIDSFLPIHPDFDFLYNGSYKVHPDLGSGYRLKTIKLRGQISQGLILPLVKTSVTGSHGIGRKFDLNIGGIFAANVSEGEDFTDALGVKKWEAPIAANLAGIVRSTFPSFIPKTDQERIQNCFNDLKYKWNHHPFEVTLKLDGSSMTVFYNREDFGVCSRNMDLRETEENSFWQAARKYELREKLTNLGRNIAIQGELCGPGIQGNREKFSDLRFYVFDMYDIDQGRYLTSGERTDLAEQLQLFHVPVLAYGWMLKDSDTVRTILDLANIGSINHAVAEGIVFKSLIDPSVSFKAISDAFLLKENETL